MEFYNYSSGCVECISGCIHIEYNDASICGILLKHTQISIGSPLITHRVVCRQLEFVWEFANSFSLSQWTFSWHWHDHFSHAPQWLSFYESEPTVVIYSSIYLYLVYVEHYLTHTRIYTSTDSTCSETKQLPQNTHKRARARAACEENSKSVAQRLRAPLPAIAPSAGVH